MRLKSMVALSSTLGLCGIIVCQGCHGTGAGLSETSVPHTLSARVQLSAGEADGNSNPKCPPAQCGWVEVHGIPMNSGCCDIRVFGKDIFANAARYECTKQPPNSGNDLSVQWWNCGPNYASFDGPPTITYQGNGQKSLKLVFRSWRSQGQEGTLEVT